MKLIIAVVRPFKITAIVDAMNPDADFPGLTVLNSRGFGREKSAPHVHTAAEDLHDFDEGAMLMVAAPDDAVQRVCAIIERIAHTGRPGDGKLFVLPMEDAVRIATGERLDAALR